MSVKILDLKKQYLSIQDEINGAIKGVIESTSFVGGSYLESFEKDFASYHGMPHCIGVGNGTDAIEIVFESLHLPKGSEVIVPANSFIASSEAVSRSGHHVTFCDIDPQHFTISLPDLKKRISSKTKAILAVHLYGHSCDMDAILALARDHNLKVIEDCSQCHGGKFNGKPLGSLGYASIFSFYPAKNLGAFGDGGAILTRDHDLAHQCRLLSNHGRTSKYEHAFEGRNSRLDGLQAAILQVKLKHLDSWIETRRRHAAIYRESLKGNPGLILPVEEKGAYHAYHLFVIRTPHREALKDFLANQDIETGIHYPIPLPRLEAYHNSSQAKEPFIAADISNQLLSLPIGEHLEAEQVHYVAETIRRFFDEKGNNDIR